MFVIPSGLQPKKSASAALIPQRLPRLQGVLNSFLGLSLSAERLERLPLQIQNVLLADRSSRRNMSSAEHFRDLGSDLHFMITDVPTLPHQVNAQFQCG